MSGMKTMKHELTTLRAETLAIQAVLTNVLFELKILDPVLAEAIGRGFESAAKRNYAFKELPVRLPPMQRRLAIVVLKGRTLSPIAQLFIETVRSVAKPRTNARKPGSTRHASSRA
jgi:hypothetical protein